MKQDNQQKSAAPGGEGAQPIRIMGFVDSDAIPAACYEQPYCLEPSRNDSKAYDVLRDVMQRTRKVGVAAVMIEKRPRLAAIFPIGRTLVLNVLRLATSLVPKRAREQADEAPAVAIAKPRVKSPQLVSVRARSDAPKAAMRSGTARKQGEVIDLAARRSSKRAAQGRRGAKSPRTRTAAIATLHELPRKSTSQRAPVEIQLA